MNRIYETRVVGIYFSFSVLKKGDQIAVFRKLVGDDIGYYHHGIYISENQVIHFQGETMVEADGTQPDAYVHSVPFSTFASRDEMLYRVCHKEEKTLQENEVVSLAEEDCKGSAHKNTYKAESKNCEHMANKWKTGKSFSEQAKIAVTAFSEGRKFLGSLF